MKLVTINEVAERLGKTPRTVRTYCAQRIIPYYKHKGPVITIQRNGQTITIDKGSLSFDLSEVEEAYARNCRVAAIGEPKRRIGRVTPSVIADAQ